MNDDRTGFSLNDHSLSCQLIKLSPLYLFGGIHRRDLRVFPHKGSDDLPDRVRIDLHRFFRKHISGDIFCVCRSAEQQRRRIGFIPVSNLVAESGRLPEADRQHAFRIRIQRTCMADFLLAKDTS